MESARRILIVDDDPSVRHMLGRVLRDENYEVLSAANGQDGLQMAAQEGVDLLLLDLRMPKVSGCEVLRQLALSRPGLPVIIITAWARQELEGRLGRVSAVLQKPLDFPILLETIQRLLSKPTLAKGGSEIEKG
jgi:DNA-binding response OmpR family regulator